MSNATLTTLAASLADLVRRLDSLEARLPAVGSVGQTIAAASASPMQTAPIPTPTKGKVRAQAAPTPSKAKPAKKKDPTKKKTIPSNPLPLHLAQTFPQEGKPDRHLVTVAIPDATAAHVIGQGGKGLKQIHDISGARVSAYTLVEGSRDERHISIRGTDQQIGDALVVLGKRVARKRIHLPKPKKPEPTAGALQAAQDANLPSAPAAGGRLSAPRAPSTRPSATFPAPSLQPSAPSHLSTQRDWSTPVSRTPSQGEQGASATPPSVQMASPSPVSTPHVPTVAMSSPSSSSTPTASPMHVDAVSTHGRAMPESAHPDARRAAADTPRPQTARRGGGPPRGR